MCDENKTPETEALPLTDVETADAAPESAPAADAAADLADAVALAADALSAQADGAAEATAESEEELEQLRRTFQTEYDKARAEAEMPEIQALEDPAGAAEEEDPEEPDAPESETKGKKAPKEKNHKKRTAVLAVILTLVCLLIVLPLILFFVLTIKAPNLPNYLSASVKAQSAADPAAQIDYYKEALGYCEDNDLLGTFTQELHERIAVATAEKDGYSAAMSYAKTYLSEEELASPKVKEFRALLEVSDSIDSISAKAESAVAEALGDGTDASAPDYEAVARSLGAPNVVVTEVADALRQLGEALAAEKTAETKEDEQTAITAFLGAYTSFKSLGAKGQALLESVAIRLYNGGYAYETRLLFDNYFDEEMLAAPISEEITVISGDLDALKGCGEDVYALAVRQREAGKTQPEDFYAAVTADLSDRAKTALAQLAQTVADALQAEEEKDLTKASQYLSTALAAEAALELPTKDTAAEAFSVYFAKGDIQSAESVAAEYFPDDAIDGTDAAFAGTFAEFRRIYSAQDAANEIFSPAYYEMAYYGTALDKAALNASFDELAADSSTPYAAAYASYYKYLTEAFTDQDYAVMQTHLDAFAEQTAAYPMLAAHSLIQLYRTRNMNAEAIAQAKTVLETDVSDDLANGMLAMEARMNGDVQGSLSIAEKGIELSGTRNECAYQAAVAYLLLGDYEKAYELAEDLYTNNLSIDTAELIKVIAETYDGGDTELSAKLQEVSADVDDKFEQAQIEFSENTAAVIGGEKTLEEVFLSGIYALR